MSRLSWISNELEEQRKARLLRSKIEFTPLADGLCEFEGRRLRNFAGNDYLNLAHDQRLIDAACKAAKEAGVGSRASAVVCGRSPWHVRLEQKLGDFEGQESALLFPTGFATNIGVIAALVDSNDIVFCDRLNHASLVDGCRLSGARLRVFRHRELSGLARELAKADSYRRRLIVIDGVFSMDGDIAPLADICDLAEAHDAMVLVDEAHGTGVLGANGRGACEATETEERVTVRIGTLSKALGSLGGFVTGSESLIEYLLNSARTQIYSTAIPPSVCASALEAIKIVEAEPERRRRLEQLSSTLHQELASAGILPLPGCQGAICPIPLTSPEQATLAAEKLRAAGFLVGAIRPPTVPKDSSRLRITLSCAHSESDVRDLVKHLVECL
ncbi:MAG: 8-amino-7-oxononanoate synthase [Planctomycetaceae bacterium]|nr:8-amino-7-oxononanoate synthase [Planctomycetaceae bacterium]